MDLRSQNVRLLQLAFSQKEWKYLSSHKTFKAHLHRNITLDDYEELVKIGTRLLWHKEVELPILRLIQKEKTLRQYSSN